MGNRSSVGSTFNCARTLRRASDGEGAICGDSGVEKEKAASSEMIFQSPDAPFPARAGEKLVGVSPAAYPLKSSLSCAAAAGNARAVRNRTKIVRTAQVPK